MRKLFSDQTIIQPATKPLKPREEQLIGATEHLENVHTLASAKLIVQFSLEELKFLKHIKEKSRKALGTTAESYINRINERIRQQEEDESEDNDIQPVNQFMLAMAIAKRARQLQDLMNSIIYKKTEALKAMNLAKGDFSYQKMLLMKKLTKGFDPETIAACEIWDGDVYVVSAGEEGN